MFFDRGNRCEVPIANRQTFMAAILMIAVCAQEMMEIIAWNIAPNSIQYAIATPIGLELPVASAVLEEGAPIEFAWESTGVNDWSLFVYPAAQPIDDNPLRVYEGLVSPAFTLPIADALPAGEYVWYVVGDYDAGIVQSATRSFIVAPSCPADFNHDGILNPDDLSDYITCYFDSPPCAGADFNHDTNVNPDDLADYLIVYFTGC